MKKLLIIGGLLAVGAVAYTLYKRKQEAEEQAASKRQEETDPFEEAEEAPSPCNVQETKKEAARQVHQRHSEASQTIRDALNTILSTEEKPNVETDHDQDLEEVSNALDELLNGGNENE